MGCWDIFCVVCGNTCHDISNSSEESEQKIMKEIGAKLKWLNKCTFLTIDNKIVHGCVIESCNILFGKGKDSYTQLSILDVKGSVIDVKDNMCKNVGVFLHTDCWKYVKNVKGICLKYSDFPILLHKIKSHRKFFNISYGKIEKYWDQYFMFDMAYDSNEIDLCMSPLKNTASAKTINKVLSQLKITKNDERIGPNVSATFYDKGNVKIGNDGNFWQIKNGKWTKINKFVISTNITISYKDNKAMKKLAQIPQIGDVNLTCGLFVSKFVLRDTDMVVTLIHNSNAFM